MRKPKKRYEVFSRATTLDEYATYPYDIQVSEWEPAGTTFAVSEKQAISNIKYRIKTNRNEFAAKWLMLYEPWGGSFARIVEWKAEERA